MKIKSILLHFFPQLIEQNIQVEGVDTFSDPCVWLDYLATIFRSMANILSRLDDNYRRSHLNSGGSELLNSAASGAVLTHNQAEVNSLAESAQSCLEGSMRVVTGLVWPVISRVLDHYGSKMRPMERCCRVIRFMVRSFSVNLRELLPDIANQVSSSDLISLSYVLIKLCEF